MSWASTADLRGLIYTTMTDDELETIIDLAQADLETTTGTVANPTSTHRMACLYQAAIFTLRRMKTNSELPLNQIMGSKQQTNQVEGMIDDYERKVGQYKMLLSISSYSGGGFYARAGANWRDEDA